MLIDIRPFQLFNLVETSNYQERLVKFVLPTDKTPVLLETSTIISLIKIIDPETYFEIGTYLGLELMNVAANIRSDAKIFTLDLDQDSFKKAKQLPIDKALSETHFDNLDNLAFLNTKYEKIITQLFGDSTKFDFSSFYKTIDFIYIDGSHDYASIKSDTENAFRMISQNHKACILWHDYLSNDYPDVTEYIKEISAEIDIFCVGSTRHCFYLNKECSDLYKKLKPGA